MGGGIGEGCIDAQLEAKEVKGLKETGMTFVHHQLNASCSRANK